MNSLTLDELAELRLALDIVHSAGSRLAGTGFEVTVTLTAHETLLRCGGIWPVGGLGGEAPLVEPAPEPAGSVDLVPAPEPVISAPVEPDLPMPAPASVQAAPVAFATTRPPVAAPAPAPTPEAGPGRWVERERGADGLWRGPWLDAEVAELLRARAKGEMFKDIAVRLQRPKDAVAVYHRSLERRAERGQKPQTAAGPDATQIAPDTTGPATAGARPVSPAAGLVGAGGSPAPTAATAAPAALSGEARRLWDFVQRVERSPRWGLGDDLALVEGLSAGRKLAEIALDLDVDTADAKARFALLSQSIRDDRGHVRFDGQAALIIALRAAWQHNAARGAA